MTLAIIRREPAHIDREHWRYERVTTPRESWMADNRRRVERLIREMKLGDEVCLPDGRHVLRDCVRYYHVFNVYRLQAVCIRDEILPFLLDGVPPAIHDHSGKHKRELEAEQRVMYPARKSPYRCVVYNRRTGKWYAQVGMNTHSYKLPHRNTDAEAARDYDNFVIKHGLNRPLNFPLEQQEAA